MTSTNVKMPEYAFEALRNSLAAQTQPADRMKILRDRLEAQVQTYRDEQTQADARGDYDGGMFYSGAAMGIEHAIKLLDIVVAEGKTPS